MIDWIRESDKARFRAVAAEDRVTIRVRPPDCHLWATDEPTVLAWRDASIGESGVLISRESNGVEEHYPRTTIVRIDYNVPSDGPVEMSMHFHLDEQTI